MDLPLYIYLCFAPKTENDFIYGNLFSVGDIKMERKKVMKKVMVLGMCSVLFVTMAGVFAANNADDRVSRDNVGYSEPDNTSSWTPDDFCGEFGKPGDIPIVGDWDCSGVSQIGVFRSENGKGYFYLDMDYTLSWTDDDIWGQFGKAGDIPIVMDFLGSGCDNCVGVFRDGNWYIDLDGSLTWNNYYDAWGQFGKSGDIPMVGDWGNGWDDFGIYRPSTSVFYLDLDSSLSRTPGEQYSYSNTSTDMSS